MGILGCPRARELPLESGGWGWAQLVWGTTGLGHNKWQAWREGLGPKGLCGLSSEVKALLGGHQELWKNDDCHVHWCLRESMSWRPAWKYCGHLDEAGVWSGPGRGRREKRGERNRVGSALGEQPGLVHDEVRASEPLDLWLR